MTPAEKLREGLDKKITAQLTANSLNDAIERYRQVVELERLHSVAGAMKTLGLDDDRLRAMLLLLHPDKHANSAAANEAAKWVNGLRDVLKENRKS